MWEYLKGKHNWAHNNMLKIGWNTVLPKPFTSIIDCVLQNQNNATNAQLAIYWRTKGPYAQRRQCVSHVVWETRNKNALHMV